MESAFTSDERGIVFRQIKKEEISLFAPLYSASFGDKAAFLPFEEGMVNERESYGAFDGQTPIAMVTANPVVFRGKRGHQIFKLCAHADYRGTGVARALVAFMHEAQKKKGDLFSLVMPGHEKLYDFYKKCGYFDIRVSKRVFLPGQVIILPESVPCYTEQYEAYCKKSAKENGKTSPDGQSSFWGFEKDGLILVDDCLGRSGVCTKRAALYLPDEEGAERCGMVCPFDQEADLSGIFISLANGF